MITKTRGALVVALSLALVPVPDVRAQNSAVTITVDVNANRHSISPQVYGLSESASTPPGDPNCPLNRHGGTPTSRYNWLQNADNRAADWYFESIASASSVQGEVGDTFIQQTKSVGAQ